MGFHVARMIHIYLYAANRLWDTDRISRLQRLPLEAARDTYCGKNLRYQRKDRSSGSITRALVDDSTGRLFGGQSTSHDPQIHVALFLKSSRESRHVLLDGGSGAGGRRSGTVWSAVSVDDKSPMHLLKVYSLAKNLIVSKSMYSVIQQLTGYLGPPVIIRFESGTNAEWNYTVDCSKTDERCWFLSIRFSTSAFGCRPAFAEVAEQRESGCNKPGFA
jgi:hypothetical protein